MYAFRFTEYFDPEKENEKFDQFLKLFIEINIRTSGDVNEALNWMNVLDKKYKLSDDEYGMEDFIQDLKEKGYLSEEIANGSFDYKLTAKSEQSIRKSSLEEIFGKLKKSKKGNHQTNHSGKGADEDALPKSFEFGDRLESILLTESIRNAQINHGVGDFHMEEGDLEVRTENLKTETATVLMIDLSHSMILYGEDRITPAKKTAMALAELIKRKYPKDSLDIVVFGNDAKQIQVKDLPYLDVGPFHTNTVAGLEMAMDLLRRKKTANKQIFMITDGKPTCLKIGGRYYKNSFGLDRKIINKTLGLAGQCKKLGIKVTTFMLATDPYLQEFVRKFTEMNQGKAFYTGLDTLGEYIFEDFESNKRKFLR